MRRRTLTVVLILSMAGSSAMAATDEEKCHSKKLKLAGVHAACRLKADAKAVKKNAPPDYTKCDEKLSSKFGKTEEKAGPDVCPTEGDALAIGKILEAATTRVKEQLEAPDAGCPEGYRERTPDQVISDWLAAAGALDLPLLLCNYHPQAHIIDDQGVLVGHTDIGTAYQSLWDLFDGITPQVHVLDVYGDTARLLYSIDAGWVEIADGADSFLIEDGRIRFQTRHGLITFNGPPPPS